MMVIKARIAGVFYLLSILAGMCAEMILRGGLSVAANLVGTACYVVVTLILYDLFKVVNSRISLLAALFSLAGCIIGALGFLDLPAPSINSLVFFGFYCLLLAYLIFKSAFMPRFLSVLLTITGLGWLTFLEPALGRHLFFPFLMITGLVGEGALMICLLAFGVGARPVRESA